MQLLIDTETETLAGLQAAHYILGTVIAAHSGDAGYTPEILAAAAPRAPKPLHPPAPPVRIPAMVPPAPPAPPLPADAPPPPFPVEHPPVHPDAVPSENVPAGTIDPVAAFGNPTAAGTAPSAPPAPSTTQGTALPATTAPAAPSVGAPVAGTSVATAPESASPGATAERDSRNFPWDQRIHSETRKKNADGTWRYRRNLDPNVKAVVDAELAATYGQQVIPPAGQPAAGVAGSVPMPPAAPSVPVPPPAAASVPVPPAPAAGGVPASVAPPAPGNNGTTTAQVVPFPPVPPPPVPVPAQAAGVPNTAQPFVVSAATDFRSLMIKANQAIAAGKMTHANLAEACKAVCGTETVSVLASQPAKVPEVDTYINTHWLGVAA